MCQNTKQQIVSECIEVLEQKSNEYGKSFNEILASCGKRKVNQNNDYQKAKFFKKLYIERPNDNEHAQASAVKIIYLRLALFLILIFSVYVN